MKKAISIIILFIIYGLVSHAEEISPVEIVKKCIEKHGGIKKFDGIKDIYAKMDVVSYSKKGKIESIFYEYFRKPDKMRLEIHPLIDPPVKISYDGTKAWQLLKDKIEEVKDKRQTDRLQESLRFIKLMILTNLLEKDSVLKYKKSWKPKNKKFKIHIIEQKNKENEEVEIYISDKTFVLLGAGFYWRGTKTLFRVFFYKHMWVKVNRDTKLYLPTRVELYKEKDLIMRTKLRIAKINSLKNGNTFFKDLREKAKIKKIGRRGRGR